MIVAILDTDTEILGVQSGTLGWYIPELIVAILRYGRLGAQTLVGTDLLVSTPQRSQNNKFCQTGPAHQTIFTTLKHLYRTFLFSLNQSYPGKSYCSERSITVEIYALKHHI